MKTTNNLDLDGYAILQALLHPVASAPVGAAVGQVWFSTVTEALTIQRTGGPEEIAFISDVTAGAITSALWNAQSVIVAVTDDTPTAVTISEGTVLGRTAGGDIGAVSAAQLRTILNVENGATADQSAAELLAALLTVDGPASGLDADTLDGVEASGFATAGSIAGLASESYVDTAISNLIDTSPGTLDTLNELAAALGDDPNFAATVTASIATKTGKVSADIGTGAATTIDVPHTLGTLDVVVSVVEVSTGDAVIADWKATSTTNVRFSFGTAPATDSLRATIVG